MIRRPSVLLLAALLCCPSLAHGERLGAAIDGLLARGYSSPLAAVTRLQAVEDRPADDAPLAQRHAYQAAVGRYAAQERRPAMAALAQQASAALEKMARDEQCRACAIDQHLIQARWALTQRVADRAQATLDRIDTLPGRISPAQQQQLHYLRARQYQLQSRLDMGIREALLAIELAGQHTADQLMAQNLLAVLNVYLGDYPRTIEISQGTYARAERMGFTQVMAESKLNMGFAHLRDGRRDLQLKLLEDVLALTRDDEGLAIIQSTAVSNLADYWLSQRDYARALAYSEQAVELARRIDDPLTLAYALINRGAAQAGLGQAEAGVADARQAIALTDRIGARTDHIGMLQELVNIHEHAGDYRNAFLTLRRVEGLQQEITRQAREKAVLDLQEKYASESRQREIERLAAANRLKEAELATQAVRRQMWAAFSLALVLLAVVLVQWLHRSRRANRRLSRDVANLAEQSIHDPLTRVHNRRHGQALLAGYGRSVEDAPSGNPPLLGLMLLDIDFFKQVNDNHGHPAGDKVLVEVAHRLRALLREQDAVVRWGGEEFLLLLPGLQATALPALADRLLRTIGTLPIALPGADITLTASIGAIGAPFAGSTDTDALIQLADLALYRAKASGRNRALCITALQEGLDPVALARDLAAAQQAGQIGMTVVSGPV
ncbi:diguanylate cyclase [Stenotrophomonas sp. MYb238]|uniref:diguanylate cyclase n=1 Tax=Stenotrophomonas sp. MYb238 TaxID=2040281 RepID=UPI0012918E23|nr:diguanylate cyclase [Stenotrophomonas sp. MYb238]MQP75601.1 diguanylate cyclase [Stenotrophomonas sp. MYb238]